MSKNKVEINKKDLKALQSKFKDLNKFDKYLDKEISVMAAKSRAEAVERYTAQWGTSTGNLRNAIRAGRKKLLHHYIKIGVKYAAYLEWGTRRKFKPGNLKLLDELGIPRSYAAQWKASPLKRMTNIEGRPYFFPSIKNQIKEMNKRLKKRLQKITK